MLRAPDYAETLESRTQPKSRNLGTLKSLLGYAKPYKWIVFKAFLAIFCAALIVLGLGQGIRLLVDQGFGSADPLFLYKALSLMSSLVVLLALASFARVYYMAWLGERVVADLRMKTFEHLLTLTPSFFESRGIGDIVSRLLTDSTLVQVVIGTSIPIALRNVLLFIGGVILLFATSPKLTMFVALLIPFVVVPIIFYGRRVRSLSRASQERVGKVGAFSEEIFESMRTVQSFVREAYEVQSFNTLIGQYFEVAVRQVKARALLTMLVMTVVFGALCAVLWIGGLGVKNGEFSAGELSSFLFYAALVGGAAGAISEIMGDLQRAAGALERILELFKTSSRILVLKNPKSLDLSLRKTEDKTRKTKPFLSFENVEFSYPSRPEEKILQNFSLNIHYGEHIALVGPSGVGKSTVFALALRFFDPDFGKISFEGIDLKDLEPHELRKNIAWVSQESVIFTRNVQDNILYGRLDATDEEVEIALKEARAWEFVERLPHGIKDFVGERGGELSGGQKQRLALARAFLKNAPLLLLDEATSSLDAVNERLIQNAMESMMKGRGAIVIAHRLATVKKSDRIVVLDHGGIILGIGVHEDLIERIPLYRNLVELELLT